MDDQAQAYTHKIKNKTRKAEIIFPGYYSVGFLTVHTQTNWLTNKQTNKEADILLFASRSCVYVPWPSTEVNFVWRNNASRWIPSASAN